MLFEALTIGAGTWRERAALEALWIGRKKLPGWIVKSGRYHVRLRLERRQNLGGILGIVERQCGRAVGGDHLAERREVTDGRVAEGKELVRHEGGGREQQYRA